MRTSRNRGFWSAGRVCHDQTRIVDHLEGIPSCASLAHLGQLNQDRPQRSGSGPCYEGIVN